MRVAEQRAELARIRACLDAAPGALAPMLRASLQSKFRECSARIADALAGGDSDTPEDEAWTAHEDSVHVAEQLRTEVFCYVAGALLRRDGIDRGVGKAADLLLDELAERAGLANRLITSLSFTAGEESLNQMINLVRLRFPGAGVWDLPVVAHEFGHYMMRELPAVLDTGSRPIIKPADELSDTVSRPIIKAVDELALTVNDSVQHVEELFADVCATYALGPSYPLSCAALRVRHCDLDTETTSHPAWRRRGSAMIETLQYMADEAGIRGIAIKKWVRPLWAALSVGPAPGGPTVSDERLKIQVHRMTSELLQHAYGLHYDMGDPADLADVVATELANTASGAYLPLGCTVAHVLNGAWRWRLDHFNEDSVAELDRVSTSAIALCERVRAGNEADGNATAKHAATA